MALFFLGNLHESPAGVKYPHLHRGVQHAHVRATPHRSIGARVVVVGGVVVPKRQQRAHVDVDLGRLPEGGTPGADLCK